MTYSPLAVLTRPNTRGYSGARVVNYFAQSNSDGVSPSVLIGRPGLTLHAQLPTPEPIRAMAEMGGDLFVVAGPGLWRLGNDAPRFVGPIDVGEVAIAASASEIAVTAGGRYFLSDGDSVQSVQPGAVDRAVGVAFLDGYFIVIGEIAGRRDGITVSALDNGRKFDATEFAFAESSPDPLVSVSVDHNELWLFGEKTIQRFYNSGSAVFPFAPNAGALIEQGCAGAKLTARADNAVYWVTPDGKVGRSFGGPPEWVTTPEIKAELVNSQLERLFAFSEAHHEFVAVARTGQPTLVYDLTTGLWHERTTGPGDRPWVASCAFQYRGRALFGTVDGRLCRATPDTYQDLGENVFAEVCSPLMVNRGESYRVSALAVDFGGGADDIERPAQVMLQTSRDGFRWGIEKWRKLAGVGRYGARVEWRGLGRFYRGSVRIRISDPVNRDIHGVAVKYA